MPCFVGRNSCSHTDLYVPNAPSYRAEMTHSYRAEMTQKKEDMHTSNSCILHATFATCVW